MNNIISFRSAMAACYCFSADGWCKVVDSKNQQKLGTRTSECATAALNGMCQELAMQRMFPGPWYARNKQPWTSCFIGYLYMRVTSTSVTSTASRKRIKCEWLSPSVDQAMNSLTSLCTFSPVATANWMKTAGGLTSPTCTSYSHTVY